MGQISSRNYKFLGSSTDITDIELKFVADNTRYDLQRLGKELQFSPTILSKLHESQKVSKEKSYELMARWIQKNGKKAKKKSLITALTNIPRKDVSDKLTNSAALTKDDEHLTDFTKIQNRLYNKYINMFITQPPGIDRDIESAFMEAEMVTYDDNDSMHKEKMKLTNFFEKLNEKTVSRILVEGNSGYGKTTLATKLACDWAKGKEYICSQFSLVLVIPLKEVKEQVEDFIINIVCRANGITLTKEELITCLATYKVLLVLDGCNEMTTKCRENLEIFLEEKELKSTCILITGTKDTLPSKKGLKFTNSSLIFDEQIKFCTRRVLLKGFTMHQRNQILEKHFKNNSEVVKQIQELFRDNDVMKCPVFVFWVGWMLGKYKNQEMQTRTKFYKSLISVIIFDALVRDGKIKDKDDFNIFDETNNGIVCSLMDELSVLGKLALEKLKNKNLSFTPAELQCISNSILLVSGIFIVNKPLNGETYYLPMHKSVLEFLAAFSISIDLILGKTEFNEFKKILSDAVKTGLVPSLDSLFFPFLAGLMGQNAHLLFESLLPWAPIYHVCQQEMMNVLLELENVENVDDKIIESLIDFVPSYYRVFPTKGIPKKYFLSECYQKLFNRVAENTLTVLNCNLSVFEKLELHVIDVDKFYLRLSNDNPCEIKPHTSIKCKDLICYVNVDLEFRFWNSYMPLLKQIRCEYYHLFVVGCNSSTCTMILKEITKSQFTFTTIRFLSCFLEDKHLEVLIELVKQNRIKKRIILSLGEHAVTVDVITRLWHSVVESNTISEFSFTNTDSKLKPVFDLKDVSGNTSLKMIDFGLCTLKETDSNLNNEAVQELILYNNINSDVNVTTLLESFVNVKYMQCFDSLFTLYSIANVSLFSSLEELNLDIDDQFYVPPKYCILDQMPNLRVLTLDFTLLSLNCFPYSLETFVAPILNSQELKILAFHDISSLFVFDCLVNIFSKVDKNKVECLELMFKGEWTTELCISSGVNKIKELLRTKQLTYVAIIDWYFSVSLRSVLPFLFSENEFHFQYEIHGYENNHSVASRQFFECFMVNTDRFRIGLKQDIQRSESITII